jgi:hypothetical protein
MPGQDATVSKPLRLGLDDVETTTGWALTDSAAAAAYGAPLAVRSGQLLDFYVPDQATLRRAIVLLSSAPSRSEAHCGVRVAPVGQRVVAESTWRPTRGNGPLPIRSSLRWT